MSERFVGIRIIIVMMSSRISTDKLRVDIQGWR